MNYLFILLAALIAVANPAPKESYKTLRGKVTDKNTGKSLSAAEIILKSEGKTFTTVTDEYGAFKIQYEPGEYNMTVSYMCPADTLFKITLKPEEKALSLQITPGAYYKLGMEDIEGLIRKGSPTKDGIGYDKEKVLTKESIGSGKALEGKVVEVGAMASAGTEAMEASAVENPLVPSTKSEGIEVVADRPKAKVERYASEATSIGSSAKPSPSISPKAVSQVSAGKLTSGEVNDFRKWEQWQDFASNELVSNRLEWDYNPSGRIVAQLETESGYPAVGADVRLFDEQGNEIWRTKSDNTGKAELWSTTRDSAKASFGEPAKIIASFNGDTRELKSPKNFYNGVNFIKFDAGCPELKRADILFAVDATGSMGDEIEYLKAELKDIIGKVTEKHKDMELNLGSVFYRDFKDDYLVKKFDFTRDIDSIQKFIDAQGADGGGDTPEAVENALQTALDNMAWSENAMGRILFLILDAPPHNTEINRYKMDILARKAALMGVRIVPVACSGIDKSTEYLMRSIALATNGTYIFLTNHSGIGGDHIAPTTDKYDVEFLNGLFVRIIDQFITAPSCEEKAPIAGLDVTENVFNKNENRVEPKAAPALKCYPNPTDGELTIDCAVDIDELYLADLAGKLVMSFGSVPKGARKIFLGEFPTGVYFLKYSVKGAWAVEKTFLQK